MYGWKFYLKIKKITKLWKFVRFEGFIQNLMSFNFYQFLRDGLGHGHLGSALFLNSKSQIFFFLHLLSR